MSGVRTESVDANAPPSTYYTTGRNAPRTRTRTYTVSNYVNIIT